MQLLQHLMLLLRLLIRKSLLDFEFTCDLCQLHLIIRQLFLLHDVLAFNLNLKLFQVTQLVLKILLNPFQVSDLL